MDIIKQALKVMESEFKGGEWLLNSSQLAKDFCRLQIGNEKDEVFAVLFLDSQLKNLGFKIFFYGTVNECSIHLRPIVRHALELNAAKMILVHNHPSGNSTPSESDIHVTKDFVKFFRKINCDILDHLIVSPIGVCSLNELGHM